MENRLPVLIVGGGPTGLVMGCQLLMRGINCRIIDRLEAPVTTSRSFTIHARTMELLRAMGLHHTYLQRGFPVYAMQYHFMGKDESPYLDFHEVDSPYAFCLNINQNETEAILRDKLNALGGQIEWNLQLEELQGDENGVTCTVTNRATGETETIEADWVIGCDGIRSAVRRNMDIPFDGEEYTGMEMKMMDVAVEGFAEPIDRIHYFITKEHMLLFARLPNENFRVLVSDMGGAQTETVREAFQQVADVHFNGSVQIGEPVWATNFKISRRKVDTFRQGRIFLAGDSAHVNSPAGGQGMNASMQDAFNLAWKLAAVVSGEASETLLDTYEAERNPVAAQVVEGTHFLNGIIMAHGRNMEDRIAMTQAPGWNRKAVNQISGVSYTYRDSTFPLLSLDVAPDTPLADTPLALDVLPGDRCPHLKMRDDLDLYDSFCHPAHTILYIVGDNTSPESVARYRDEALAAVRAFKIALKPVIVVPPGPLQDAAADLAVADTQRSLRPSRDYADSVYLVRPDGYIGACCPAAQADVLFNAMTSIYKTQ